MPEHFVNKYQVSLAADITSGALTGTVTSTTGIPATPFRAIISAEGDNNDEIVLVTGRSGATLTWTRAAEAVEGVQSASGHGVGATFTALLSAKGLLTLGSRLDIRAFGAIDDDATDNYVACTAALDYQKANGGIFYIPEGNFRSSPLTYIASGTSALHMMGAGRDRSILKPMNGTGTVLTLSGNIANSTFRDFKIDGAGGTGHGLYYSDVGPAAWLYQSTFEDLDFRNCALNGLYIKSSFANRYANISSGGNGNDQIKVWGGVGDYYERIDIGTTVTGYAGLRALYGGTFVGCNGIYTVGSAAAPMFKFGGDGSAESDSKTVYPSVHVIGGNVESFSTTGMLFVINPANVARLDRVNFLTAASAANCKAVEMLQSNTQVALTMSGCAFTLGSGASWANGYAIHTTAPVFSDGAATGLAPLAAYSDDYSLAYPISQREFGTSSGNSSTYNWKPNIMRGFTDVDYMASMGLGSAYDGNDHVRRTAAAAMPTTGTYRRGDLVDNCSHSIAEEGGAGVKYTVDGWRRLTDGSAHVLNVDWVKRLTFTGN